ncbi:hypothetical protein GCM10022398_28380 [Acetobacter lovaniensis]|uniref:Putative transposase n=1 Tax=Acetobacter lovaniensis TaxID=104100 RepID=A0A841QH15_9PROT|nr:putative transposase [Acetobacter lovaniensis]NHN81837.1 transposase [Acetobacter lovaniensis]
MKSDRFTDAQIMGVIRQAEDGVSVPDLCREHGISNATFYRLRAKYGGITMTDPTWGTAGSHPPRN